MRDGGYRRVTDLFELMRRFPTEVACRGYLLSRRWPQGFSCPRCGGTGCYFISTRHLYQCRACSYQASATAGTVMQGTRTSLRAWFALIFLMARSKTGLSILGFSRDFGISYKRALSMAGKVRGAMAARDSRYRLAGLLELDESYFGAGGHGKRGRGTDKRPVLVAVSLKGQGPAHARMQVLPSLTSSDIKPIVQAGLEEGSRVRTDGLNSWPPALSGMEHEPSVLGSPQAASEKLPWVHILIANAKGILRGVHHGVRYLQPYLSEFCWRFSRRYFEPELFDRLLCACLDCGPQAGQALQLAA